MGLLVSKPKITAQVMDENGITTKVSIYNIKRILFKSYLNGCQNCRHQELKYQI